MSINQAIGSGAGPAGTNLKVGGAEKNCSAPPLFGDTSTISRFGAQFRAGQYSLVSFLLFFYLQCPSPVPSHL